MATMEIAPNHDLLTIPGSRVSVLFHCGALEELGKLAAGLGGSRAVVISDPGIAAAGYLRRALDALRRAGLTAAIFDQVGENPTTDHVEAGVAVARDFRPDLLVGLGGGSAMDCAKGINFLLTNGGQMQDYWGHNKASRPMLPLIAIPTTAGTGSEAQSYALITDPQTHQKMACGDDKALSRIAILDAELTATTPPAVAAAAGIDALAHAIESSASTRRNDTSRPLSAEAWRRLIEAYPRIIRDRDDVEARQQMHLGAHLSGAAIENSMLGAAHACANALTAALWNHPRRRRGRDAAGRHSLQRRGGHQSVFGPDERCGRTGPIG